MLQITTLFGEEAANVARTIKAVFFVSFSLTWIYQIPVCLNEQTRTYKTHSFEHTE